MKIDCDRITSARSPITDSEIILTNGHSILILLDTLMYNLCDADRGNGPTSSETDFHVLIFIVDLELLFKNGEGEKIPTKFLNTQTNLG